MKNLLASVTLLAISSIAHSDDFDIYREAIDNYRNYSLEQRDKQINELTLHKSDEAEKYYLLGMLHTIQGMGAMTTIAKSKSKKPTIEEVLKDPVVARHFSKAESNYNAVETIIQGYKYIYCKYAELYRYSYNEKGMVSITRKLGSADHSESTQSCKKMVEDIAIGYAQLGRMEFSKSIIETAIKEWNPYPDFLLEMMGDLEMGLGNHKSAKAWWTRCANKSNNTSNERCSKKLAE